MSAYICSTEHFKALAVFATNKQRGYSSIQVDPKYIDGFRFSQHVFSNMDPEAIATFYANTLYCENYRSVENRYPGGGALPGPIELPGEITVTTKDRRDPQYAQLDAVNILKMCDGLEYQSCECDDWRKSVAYELLTAIRLAAIRTLPGYDQAHWTYK